MIKGQHFKNLQFSLLVVNYYTIILLSILYNQDNQNIMYSTLISFILIERLSSFIRGSQIYILQSGVLNIAKYLILNALFVDYSIWYAVYDDITYFDQKIFNYKQNILSNLINIIPMIFNNLIMLKGGSNYSHIYTISNIFFFSIWHSLSFLITQP
ncbi:hypothetical protein ABPG72_018652 [Tetrahymena utriculariae]